MPETPPFEGFRPEAITFLADLAANNDRAWFTPRKAEYERLREGPPPGTVRGARGAVHGARPAAHGRPRPVAVPDLPRRALRQGQVALQDGRQRALHGTGWGTGRLLPPGARRDLRGRRAVPPGAGDSRRVAAPGGRRSRRRPRCHLGPGVRGRVRLAPRRPADARPGGVREGPSRAGPARPQGPDLHHAPRRRRRLLARSAGHAHGPAMPPLDRSGPCWDGSPRAERPQLRAGR